MMFRFLLSLTIIALLAVSVCASRSSAHSAPVLHRLKQKALHKQAPTDIGDNFPGDGFPFCLVANKVRHEVLKAPECGTSAFCNRRIINVRVTGGKPSAASEDKLQFVYQLERGGKIVDFGVRDNLSSVNDIFSFDTNTLFRQALQPGDTYSFAYYATVPSQQIRCKSGINPETV